MTWNFLEREAFSTQWSKVFAHRDRGGIVKCGEDPVGSKNEFTNKILLVSNGKLTNKYEIHEHNVWYDDVFRWDQILRIEIQWYSTILFQWFDDYPIYLWAGR